MMRVVFSPLLHTKAQKKKNISPSFSHRPIAWQRLSCVYFRRKQETFLSPCVGIYQNLFFFRRISGKISRFKGCEYVYVNGKSLKIYINLWILCMRHREQESRVR